MPELALIEGNQQVATKPDESLSPSLFTFHSRFATIRRDKYYVFLTARTSTSTPEHDLFHQASRVVCRRRKVVNEESVSNRKLWKQEQLRHPRSPLFVPQRRHITEKKRLPKWVDSDEKLVSRTTIHSLRCFKRDEIIYLLDYPGVPADARCAVHFEDGCNCHILFSVAACQLEQGAAGLISRYACRTREGPCAF